MQYTIIMVFNCKRRSAAIVGALLISPLSSISAFRSQSSSQPIAVCNGKRTTICSRPSSHPPIYASVLDDDETTSFLSNNNIHDASDILNRAVEQHNINGVDLVTNNGVSSNNTNRAAIDLEQQKQQLHKQISKQRNNSFQVNNKQRQQIRKSRKNNVAMADPEFLRKRTETLLHKTKDLLYNTDNSNYDFSSSELGAGSLKVDKRTFDWLIDAWSYSGELDAADYAQSLLQRMEELRDHSSSRVYPDVKSYTKVINAISRSGQYDAGEQAEDILKRMISDEIYPNTYTYTYVIDAYAKSTPSNPNAPHAAQRLVDEMETLRSEGNLNVWPTTRAWNSVISAWSQWKGEEMAWGRVGSGAERAEACLDIMEELADTTGNKDVRPNFFNYNSVISALAKSQDYEGAAFRAESILERMENLHRTTGDDNVMPRTSTYNAIIDAWAKSGEIDAANRAELVLSHMMDLYETGHNIDAKPNVRSFNSVLNAWAKSGHPEAPMHASEVLERMVDLDRSSDLRVSPDATSFATAINAFARSHSFGKAQSAYDLFLHMEDLFRSTGSTKLRPNNIVYNSVLNACAFSVGDLEEQSHAMEIANAMLVAMNQSPYTKPDQVTYGTYLKVINNQMPPSDARDQVAEKLFRKCAKDGMVGGMVLRQLCELGIEENVKLELYRTIPWVEGDINVSSLPNEWTCNVIEGKRNRRRRRFGR